MIIPYYMKKIFSKIWLLAIIITVMYSCNLKRIDLPCPEITALVPAAARVNDTVTIQGKGFVSGSPNLYRLQIGDKTVPILDVPDGQKMIFIVPSGVGDGQVSVTVVQTSCNEVAPTPFTYRLRVKQVSVLTHDGLNKPAGLDIDQEGNVIVADRGNNRIKQISREGEISPVAGNGFNTPFLDGDAGGNVTFNAPDDVAVDGQGNIYVADDFNSCIRKIANNSDHSVSISAGIGGNSGGDDNTPLLSTFDRPRGVAVNGSDEVFVVEYTPARLRYINFSQNNVQTLLGGGTTSALNNPVRLVYSQLRNSEFPILIADRDHSRILEANVNGNTTAPIDPHCDPQDLAVDEHGNIIVLNRAGRRVSVVYKNNTVEEIAGLNINFAFESPSGIAIDTNEKIIYVSDDLANNIVMIHYE